MKGIELNNYAPCVRLHRALERAACEGKTGVVYEDERTIAWRFEDGHEYIQHKREQLSTDTSTKSRIQ